MSDTAPTGKSGQRPPQPPTSNSSAQPPQAGESARGTGGSAPRNTDTVLGAAREMREQSTAGQQEHKSLDIPERAAERAVQHRKAQAQPAAPAGQRSQSAPSKPAPRVPRRPQTKAAAGETSGKSALSRLAKPAPEAPAKKQGLAKTDPAVKTGAAPVTPAPANRAVPASAAQTAALATAAAATQASSVASAEEPGDVPAQAEFDHSAALLPFAFARKFGVLLTSEIAANGRSVVAFKTQPSVTTLTELKRYSGKGIALRSVGDAEFEELLSNVYSRDSSAAKQMVEDMGDELDLASLAESVPETEDLLEQEDDAPIIRLINALLAEAIRENASDIHIETFERELTVRFSPGRPYFAAHRWPGSRCAGINHAGQ